MSRLAVSLLAVAACKRDSQPQPPPIEESAPVAPITGPKPVSRAGALEYLRGAKRDMCACKDRTCVDLVHSDLTAWVDHQIAAAGSSATLFGPEDKRASDDLLREAFACADAVLDKGEPAKLLMATQMIATARDKARERKVRLAAAAIDVRYAKADGALDPTYGELRVVFRAPPPGTDDPARPLGAPVREHAPESADDDCPTWTFAAKTAEWTAETGPCMPTIALVPKCTVEQVWARAIADGAPKEALATLSLGKDGWRFVIEDRPRKVELVKSYADSCAPTSP